MKTLKDKINEGFFDNVGGKELIFLKDLKVQKTAIFMNIYHWAWFLI